MYGATKRYFTWIQSNFANFVLVIVIHFFLSFIPIITGFYDSVMLDFVFWGIYWVFELLWVIIFLNLLNADSVQTIKCQKIFCDSIKIIPRILLGVIVLFGIVAAFMLAILEVINLDPIRQIFLLAVCIFIIIFLFSMVLYVPIIIINKDTGLIEALKISLKLAWSKNNMLFLCFISLIGILSKIISIGFVFPRSYVLFTVSDGIVVAFLLSYIFAVLYYNYLRLDCGS
ncbi:hypothetical protein SAMN02745221_02167 [Thermosyntropha lipolytica DSM 11003]|uniref:Uncharacterized protein n=1 Tax=Thermosyntropha lipolytica DSM 11003 TaxID=1123382 RepID=A0A1M5S498_9FIRM|nr:hypothetical protein SAMN02745221_02167 [Thermosyntropha lipolytica DSM 11003]